LFDNIYKNKTSFNLFTIEGNSLWIFINVKYKLKCKYTNERLNLFQKLNSARKGFIIGNDAG
jgi:hypothetical protein